MENIKAKLSVKVFFRPLVSIEAFVVIGFSVS